MLIYSKCELTKKYILCNLNDKNYTIPIGLTFLKYELKLNNTYDFSILCKQYNVYKFHSKVRVKGHYFNGNYFMSENEDLMAKFCDYLNSILIVNKISEDDQW